LGGYSIVDDDAHRTFAQERLQPFKQPSAELVRLPLRSREEAVVRFMVSLPSNPRHDERLRHGMGAMGQDPPRRDHEQVRERWTSERDTKDFQNAQQAGKIRVEHGRCFVVVR
jgi:hypothetical protein